MDVAQLQKQFSDYTTSLFNEVNQHKMSPPPPKKKKKNLGLAGDDDCSNGFFLFFIFVGGKKNKKQGILNDQFNQLVSLQDESNPEFVFEVVTLFFEDSERLLNELSKSLGQQNVDFKKVDTHVHQLKGSSSSIGAQRVQNACIVFRNFCDEKNIEGFLEKQILAAGGSVSYS
ncbi:hypothetical protein Cgig2_003460 [Carnegiea gigantea]|uniref:Histidine-containing phosphotransfer protein n=1 Tax=Carnegiea gigantea TaxID=171969 RepID=A0A9Q1KAY4_9CARY|nr:hypothetical protein Cgig2_003460 [Carnegiea gigantea]